MFFLVRTPYRLINNRLVQAKAVMINIPVILHLFLEVMHLLDMERLKDMAILLASAFAIRMVAGTFYRPFAKIVSFE
jgi:hypothetical protein